MVMVTVQLFLQSSHLPPTADNGNSNDTNNKKNDSPLHTKWMLWYDNPLKFLHVLVCINIIFFLGSFGFCRQSIYIE